MPARPLPDPFATLIGVDDENYATLAYRYDNQRRGGDADHAAVQVTLGGAGFFQDARGRRLVGPGQALLFTHREASIYGYPPEAAEPYRLRYVTFRLGGLRPWFERLRGEFGPVVRCPPDGEAMAVLAELRDRFRRRDFRDRLHESDLLHALLVALHREQIAATQTLDPVEHGYHRLRDRFREPINLKELAAHCGVSREHFIRAFRRRHGEPPAAMLRRLRLEQATRMLRASRAPVQDIALACGFADANTFARAYRRAYGDSPSRLRRARAA